MERVKTDVLHLAYEDSGPKKGTPIILLHGWPDSPRTWDGALPALHDAGFRTITPYLRGYAPTEFRKHLLGRNPKHTGQPVAFAQDVIDLADKLKLKTFHFVGHDWGARAGYALASLFEKRLRSLTALSVPFQPGPMRVPALPQAGAFWYQWFLCTIPGAKEFARNPVDFARMMWETWSPRGWFTAGQFEEAAKCWRSPEFVEVTLHSYRVRWGHAPIDSRYDVLQDRMDSTVSLSVPTLLIQGLEDNCVLAQTTDGAGRFFTGGYRRALLEDVGHFPSREAPKETAKLILEHIQQAQG
ncbi:MAG: alpha/beta hydrolase [Acidobacteria bacterium]|nr:alpha/beta hydrolase [Acidobacteriota bacterium]